MTSTEFCVSCGGPEACGCTDDGPAERSGKTGDRSAGEDKPADGNKTSETTCRNPKNVLG